VSLPHVRVSPRRQRGRHSFEVSPRTESDCWRWLAERESTLARALFCLLMALTTEVATWD
jgi:hypothetical protein